MSKVVYREDLESLAPASVTKLINEPNSNSYRLFRRADDDAPRPGMPLTLRWSQKPSNLRRIHYFFDSWPQVSIPNALDICSAIFRQPKRGLRRFISTTVSMSSLEGPLGPERRRFLGL